MYEGLRRFECFTLSYAPNAIQSQSQVVGILLREMPTEGLRSGHRAFAGLRVLPPHKLRKLLKGSELKYVEASLQEVQNAVTQSTEGQHEALDRVLEELLRANSGLYASDPEVCLETEDPAAKLNALSQSLVA